MDRFGSKESRDAPECIDNPPNMWRIIDTPPNMWRVLDFVNTMFSWIWDKIKLHSEVLLSHERRIGHQRLCLLKTVQRNAAVIRTLKRRIALLEERLNAFENTTVSDSDDLLPLRHPYDQAVGMEVERDLV